MKAKTFYNSDTIDTIWYKNGLMLDAAAPVQDGWLLHLIHGLKL